MRNKGSKHVMMYRGVVISEEAQDQESFEPPVSAPAERTKKEQSSTVSTVSGERLAGASGPGTESARDRTVLHPDTALGTEASGRELESCIERARSTIDILKELNEQFASGSDEQ